MNIEKSLKVATAKSGINLSDLARKLSLPTHAVYNWTRASHIPTKHLEKVAAAFDLKVSEFIALGEE